MRKALLVALVALPVALAAACGGDDGGSGEPGTAVASPEIGQEALKFEPNEVTIVAGDSVKFVNHETALHTVNINDEDASGDMQRDDVYEHTFDDAGTFEITCKYHPQMRATVYVVEGS